MFYVFEVLKMISIFPKKRNQRRQHPVASRKAAQPPSTCGPHAKMATSLGGVAKAPLGAVSGAAKLPPSKVCHSKTIDPWLPARGLWFSGARPFAQSAAVMPFPSRLPRPRLLSHAQTATSLGGVAEAPLRAVSGAAEMLPSKVRRCTVHKTVRPFC